MSIEDEQAAKPRGRPPKPEAERKSDNFKFRARGDIREQLEISAAKTRRSLSEEIEHRVVQSFHYEDIYKAVDDGFSRNISLIFGGRINVIAMMELASCLNRSIEKVETLDQAEPAWYLSDAKQQILEDTFIYLARRVLRGVAARARRDAAETASSANN